MQPLLTVLAAVAIATAGCSAGLVQDVNTALLFANYSATDEPASHYFCGNHRKSPPGVPCLSNALDPGGNRLAATERVEIRG